MTTFFIFFLVSTIFIIGMILYVNNGTSLGGAEFVAKGREAGLNPKVIKMLKKTASVIDLDKPLTLLGSITHIDGAISEINSILEKEGFRNPELRDLLEELYSYRKNIEQEKRERISTITSSKEIDLEQHVKITVGNIETPLLGKVTDNSSTCLTIELFKDTNVKPGINWDGPINVYFWKKDDAGYYFESIVSESKSNRIWAVIHSNTLIRSQKREEVRIDVELNSYIYKLDDISSRDVKHEGFSGTFSQLKNISEGGAAFLVNGKIDIGDSLKIEFKLNEKIIVVCGLIRHSMHNKTSNISFVRIEFVEPKFEMLSAIRSYIYSTTSIPKLPKEMNSDINLDKAVENVEEINNNNSIFEKVEDIEDDVEEVEDIFEVEYLPEDNNNMN